MRKIQTCSAQSALLVSGFRETPHLSVTGCALVRDSRDSQLGGGSPKYPEASEAGDTMGSQLGCGSPILKDNQPTAFSDAPWP